MLLLHSMGQMQVVVVSMSRLLLYMVYVIISMLSYTGSQLANDETKQLHTYTAHSWQSTPV